MEDYINQYLTFVAEENCKFTFSPYSSNKIYYSLDSGTTWTQGSAVTVNAGTKVMWKGEMTPRFQEGVGTFSSTSLFSAEGNPMSLLFGDNFSGQTDLNLASGSGAFAGLFELCINLASIDNLVLPATTLRSSCYSLMFHGCTSLTTVPSNLLPSTTLAGGCYGQMFASCTSLRTAPELPATTLVNNCYSGMFYKCTSLTTAPQLLATTLAVACYFNMFYGCTSLNYIKCLATDISAFNATKDWTYGVASAGTFVKDASMTSWTRGDSGIPNGWNTPAEPIYKWVKLDPTTDSICAVCYPPIYRNTSGETYCSETNYDKLIDVTTEASYDNGIHWQFDHSATTVVEKDSEDCGYVPDPSEKYLTFIIENDFNDYLAFHIEGDNVIYYSLDSGSTWTQSNIIYSSKLKKDTVIMWKGEMTPYGNGIGRFITSEMLYERKGTFSVKGNIMSLIYGDNARGQTSLYGKSYAFYYLFSGCTSLTSAEELMLPATTLAERCYAYMFAGCTSLTTAPSSIGTSATSMHFYTHLRMFSGCTSLTTAPQLPALNLANTCYGSMFEGCTSLTTLPSNMLPSTTLAQNCYGSMFANCTSLTTVPSDLLPATTLASSCCQYQSMFKGCTSLRTAPELPATTLGDKCYATMFADCTSLTTAPELLAATLANFCYGGMFQGCTSLTVLPSSIGTSATTMAVSACSVMFENCISLTTIPSNLLPATTLADWCYAYMFKGCTSLTILPKKLLPAKTLMGACYQEMFRNCTSLQTAPELPATTLAVQCYALMFQNCRQLATAPELLATTLAAACYYHMFQSCENLNYIKCTATNKSANNCTEGWVYDVSSTGTFVKASSADWGSCGISTIPCDWTIIDA